jgi:hypothetical protein
MTRFRAPRLLAVIGAGGCALALLLAVFDAKAALAGWLAALVLWSAVGFGGLALRMMTQLIPGAWRDEIAPTAEMLTTLLPLIAFAALPVLVAAPVLYPWIAAPAAVGFRGVYLSAWFFDLRSVVFLLGAIGFSFRLMTRPGSAMPLAAVGLIAFVVFDTAVLVDWLMSLEPDFHSSGFGLYAFSIQMSIALAAVAGLRLIADPQARPGLFGALLLTSLLLWEYFSFMQYFIIWSENLPKQVAWFQQRGAGIWSAAEYAIGVLNLGPTFLLFFTPVRRSRRCLLAIVGAVLAARFIEIAWLVFPAVHASIGLVLAAMVLALIGLSGVSIAFLIWMAHAPKIAARAAVAP